MDAVRPSDLVTASSVDARPRVSIGLPVYNGERYVGEAIEGVLAQTFSDFELVISDNASTDGTKEICQEFARNDARVRYSRSPENLGAAPNFNRCFALAQPTEYFKWITYDDLMSDDFLERCIEALDADPCASVAFPAMVTADAVGNVIGRQLREDLSLLEGEPGHRAQRLIEYGLEAPDIYWTVYGLMRRSAIEQTELHGNYIASDQVLLFQLALTGKFVQVPGALFIRRTHPDAWTMKTDRTPKSDAVWFGARQRSGVVLPHWTLLGRHLKSVFRGELSLHDRARCGRAVARRARREWRALGGDVKLAMRDVLGRGRA
jgi:glycosyltransferase involved in cell wall biosynthesis